MSIIIREYLDSDMYTTDSRNSINIEENKKSTSEITAKVLVVDIEGIHVGPTRNYTWYTEEALKKSIPTWTKPYERPLILHHNEKDGKTIGRVVNALYTDVHTRSKTGALVFTCTVADEEGKEGVKDGRLQTVSIGVIAHDVRCSICGQVITDDGECDHERGSIYDGKTCYWMIYSMEAKELSYVIVPSDIYANTIKIHSSNDKLLKENYVKEGEMNMAKNSNDTKESIIDEKVEKETCEDVAALKVKIAELNKTIEELKAKLADVEKENSESKKLKENAETELISLTKQLKELAIEQIFTLREQLGRPELSKDNLENRSQESLMDSILDLKEEMNITKVKTVEVKEELNTENKNIKEKIEDIKENKEENPDISTIEKPINESLIDKDKDHSSKNKEYNEKNFALNVKESEGTSNNNYEENLDFIKSFYKI